MTPSASYPLQAEAENPTISESSLNAAAMLAEAHHPGAGAIVLFSGEVRNLSNGRNVEFLKYEAHVPMASGMISAILEEARSRWKLHIAVARHRVGKVAVCESAIVVITASPHRKEAYDANRYIVDRIKHEVPIWKCEYFADGTREWGGNCNCHVVTGEVGKHVYE